MENVFSERILDIHWDRLITGTLKFHDIEPKAQKTMEEAKAFVQAMIDQELSAEYLLNLSDEVMIATGDIVYADESNPLVEVAIQEIDDDTWSNLVSRFIRCKQTIDPAVEEEFI